MKEPLRIMLPPDSVLSFGAYRLDPVSGHLYRGDAVVPLTPKAFAVLHCLASQAGRLVPKQEVLDAVWPGVFVGDAVLKVTIREIRKALTDDSNAPTYIETAHRRGYRFIASVQARQPAVGKPPLGMIADAPAPAPAAPAPPVHYAQSDGINIAYQVVGAGRRDMVFVMGWVSHLEYFWNEPSFARFLNRLASAHRLILFDKRGTGRSDPVPVSKLPTLEQRLDDVRAVMDAAGSKRATLLGVSEGGPLCSLFAATYPEKTDALIMIGSYARRLKDHDYPWGVSREDRDAFCAALVEQWGGPVGLEQRAPSRANDPAFREWWASYLRMGASPGAAVALTRMNAEIDIRDILPTIRVPTLVLHRTGDRCLHADEGRFLASRIPGARYVELAGEDHLPFVGDQDSVLAEIDRFLSANRTRTLPEGALATVLTVRTDASAAMRTHLQSVFAREVAWYRGRVVEESGTRFAAVFEGPARAVQCGCALALIAERSQLPLRAGVHIGERDPGATSGPIFDISANLSDAARPGEVLVSRAIVDLVPGSGLSFNDRGTLPLGARQLPVLAVDLGLDYAKR
jgi:pimeloyl-ACP methyl ester carboxylesterase/DNA-binding winged helix-turn-helix (wHTH) protein